MGTIHQDLHRDEVVVDGPACDGCGCYCACVLRDREAEARAEADRLSAELYRRRYWARQRGVAIDPRQRRLPLTG